MYYSLWEVTTLLLVAKIIHMHGLFYQRYICIYIYIQNFNLVRVLSEASFLVGAQRAIKVLLSAHALR